MAPFERALVAFAHPDDAEFGVGGTVALWVREGTEVHYVCFTDGSAGDNSPGATREALRPVREREQRAAAEVLGVSSVTFLGFVDGELECTLDVRRAFTREVRRIRPDVLVGPDPSRLWYGRSYINHPDHKAAGEAVLCAVMPDAPSRPQFPELLDEGLEPFEIGNLWLWGHEPDEYVDIAGVMDTKLAALAAHESQMANSPFDPEKIVRTMAEDYGEKAGMRYAEGFRVFAFEER